MRGNFRPALSQVPTYVRVVSSTLNRKVLHYRLSDHAARWLKIGPQTDLAI
jgi:hypothetical protein